MSADNGIYIGCFPNGEYRVIHAQAIENINYKPGPDGFNAEQVVNYFGRHFSIFDNLADALAHASGMEDEIMSDEFCPILEYGISKIQFPRNFKEYEKESGQVKLS